jgi:hypothetical protein
VGEASLALVMVLSACATETEETAPATPLDAMDVSLAPDAGETALDPCVGTCISHGFGVIDVPAGSEADGVCLSWTLDNDEPLFVNAILSENDGMFHHSNWFWVPESQWNMPDGDWSCSEQGFKELEAAVFGGVLFAQSTQVLSEDHRFLPGAAVRIGPRARIIAAAHLLNPTPTDVQTEMRITLDTIPQEEVSAELQPFRFTYFDLDIPAQSRAEHSSTCDLVDSFKRISDESFDLKLHYILPHYHGLGDRFRLEIAGGELDGEALYDEVNLYGHPQGRTFEEPISLGEIGAHGFRFLCGYNNTTDDNVGWGIGDQEMCVMLGFAESVVRYDLTIAQTDETGVNPEGTHTRSGPCSIVPIPTL